jgi:very-short-patch-repair endonuclease
MLQGPASTIEQSRKLRKEMSPAEWRLWRALQTRPGGLKFRKQHPAGPYTADFFCHEASLIIEVDGDAHDRGDRPERDENRDHWFARRGLEVMRVPAGELFSNLDGVVAGIVTRAGEPRPCA